MKAGAEKNLINERRDFFNERSADEKNQGARAIRTLHSAPLPAP